MAPRKKIKNPTTLFAQIEEKQYQGLRFFVFKDKKSLAEVTREAIQQYLESRAEEMVPPGAYVDVEKVMSSEQEANEPVEDRRPAWVKDFGAEGNILEKDS